MMEEEILENSPEEILDRDVPEEKPVFQPRPAWQVWLARVGLIVMIICVILYYWHIASGGRI